MLRILHSFAVLPWLLASVGITPERVNRAVHSAPGPHHAADDTLTYSVEVSANGSALPYHLEAGSDGASDVQMPPAARLVVPRKASLSDGMAADSQQNDTDCNCYNHMESARCHGGYAAMFRDAYLAGSLCVSWRGVQPWCYVSLKCMTAPGLGLSDKKECKYRSADAATCQAPVDMCDCLPVVNSKNCHPLYTSKFQEAMVENKSACVEDYGGSFCYTSLGCRTASKSNAGKCKYMYVLGDDKETTCRLRPDELATFTPKPTIAPTLRPTFTAGSTRPDDSHMLMPSPFPTPYPMRATPSPTLPLTPLPTFDGGVDPEPAELRAEHQEVVEYWANRSLNSARDINTRLKEAKRTCDHLKKVDGLPAWLFDYIPFKCVTTSMLVDIPHASLSSRQVSDFRKMCAELDADPSGETLITIDDDGYPTLDAPEMQRCDNTSSSTTVQEWIGFIVLLLPILLCLGGCCSCVYKRLRRRNGSEGLVEGRVVRG